VAISVERLLDEGVCAPDGVLRDRRRPHRRSHRPEGHAVSARQAQLAERLRRLRRGPCRRPRCPAIARGMASFPGLAHRMQEVGRIGPVRSSTIPRRPMSTPRPAPLPPSTPSTGSPAGGQVGRYRGAVALFPKIVRAYLIGEAAEAFARMLNGRVAYGDERHRRAGGRRCRPRCAGRGAPGRRRAAVAGVCVVRPVHKLSR
jgi:hypothetical protein